jgi:hypothetical protein
MPILSRKRQQPSRAVALFFETNQPRGLVKRPIQQYLTCRYLQVLSIGASGSDAVPAVVGETGAGKLL